MMAECCKIPYLKTLLLLFAIFHVGHPLTPEDIGQNFYAANPSQPDDNLSCPETLEQGQQCLQWEQLCDLVPDCDDSGDEIFGLNCKSTYIQCAAWLEIVGYYQTKLLM